MGNIRNFVIIAHIDAGKSTLADRFLEITATVRAEKMRPQYLDRLDLERERGITIKMAPVRMIYHARNAQDVRAVQNEHIEQAERSNNSNSPYILNLIDTPGHSDFSYEVSRALQAVEGAVLLVDGTKGIQAQTLANFRSAKAAGLTIIGAVNKVDLHPANFERSVKELAELLETTPQHILRISAKTGQGAKELLDNIIAVVPPPKRKSDIAVDGQALIFDSLYDDHKGILAFVRVTRGALRAGNAITLVANRSTVKIKEAGYFSPDFTPCAELAEGTIGYVATGVKEPSRIGIGDTIVVLGAQSKIEPGMALPGYREPKPVVYVSFYPDEDTEFHNLKTALERLRLTDAALELAPDANDALGRGMKVGFLGQLHFEITASRLESEFNLHVITSFPSIAYRVQEGKDTRVLTTPQDFPDKPDRVSQPMIAIEIVTAPEYLSAILGMRTRYDLEIMNTKSWGDHLILTGEMPLAELIRDFDDTLKSVSQGYASWSYEISGEKEADVRKLEIMVAEETVPALTRIVPRKDVDREGRQMAERLKEILPQQQFVQAIQAKSEGRIVARETIPALKKLLGNFGKTGGDRTRKMKLWKKQARGKERLKERGVGRVKVPINLFKELLKK